MSVAQSTHLQSYEYDEDSQILTITFQNGATYQYTGVPITDYQKLVQAGGGGTVFWDLIRSKYPTFKIDSGQ